MKITLGNFYIYINLGGLFATIITPFLRNSNGGESYTLVFAVGVSTFFIASGNWKEYIPNVVETGLLCQICAYWVRILATCLFFEFAEVCKVWAKSDIVDISHFVRVPPLIFFWF